MSSAPGPVDVLGLVGSTIDQVRFDACVDGGGFGLIYRGYHQGLGETVAIKCLRIASIQRTNQEIRDALAGRFRDETKLLYRLSQGNLDIVRCISSGTVVAPKTKEYTPYMVLEWLEGFTLSAELKERRQKRLHPRDLGAAVALLDSAAGGLAYAHAHDVVHRDVKPGNLFLTRTREGVRMKVLDFGLAKILSDESIGVRPSVETGIGVHFCSPSYGAPEQFSGQVGAIGPWTDVYSLTLVLFEIMIGEKVRPATSLADGLLKAIDPQTGSPSASSLGLQLPSAVEALLLRAVAQNPLDRPRDAAVFWAALKEAMASEPKPNVAMATVMDASVGDAMMQVRAAQAGAPVAPAPLTGTMLMRPAPSGAPPPLTTAGGTEPTAAPMRPWSAAPLPNPPSAGPTSPPPPPGPDSVAEARRRGEQLKGTLPLGATSPLAASMGMPSPQRRMPSSPPGPMQPPQHHQAPPLHHAHTAASLPPPPYGSQPPRQPQPSYAPPAQANAQHHRPQGAPTDPRIVVELPPALPMKSGRAPLIVLVACLVAAVAGAAFYLLRMRGH